MKQRGVYKDVRGFCGWSFLLTFVKKTPLPYRGFIATLFETGGRISEVLRLRKRHFHFDLHPDIIVVDGMPVIKKYKKIGEIKDPSRKSGKRWTTEKLEDTRTFPIKKADPLTTYLVSHLERSKDYLFSMNRLEAFRLIRSVGESLGDQPVPFSSITTSQIYCHWFRAQRASQLKSEYNFDLLALASFFRWKIPGMGATPLYTYLSWEEMARRMGVEI
jgi:integrase